MYLVVYGLHRWFTFQNIQLGEFCRCHRDRILIITNTSPLYKRVVLVRVVHHKTIAVQIVIVKLGIHGKIARHASVYVLFLLTPYPCLSRLAYQESTVLQKDKIGVADNLPALSHAPRFLTDIPVNIEPLIIVDATHTVTFCFLE